MLIFDALNKDNMRKRILKKSEVLREGYMKGLKKAQRIINEMLVQSQGFDDDDELNSYSYNGKKNDRFTDGENLNKIFVDAILHGNMMKIKKAL